MRIGRKFFDEVNVREAVPTDVQPGSNSNPEQVSDANAVVDDAALTEETGDGNETGNEVGSDAAEGDKPESPSSDAATAPASLDETTAPLQAAKKGRPAKK